MTLSAQLSTVFTQQESRAVARRTARCCCKFPC